MDVNSPFEVIPLSPFPMRGQTLLDKADGDIQEDIEIRTGKPERTIFRLQDPFSQVRGFFRIGKLGALIGNVGIDIPVEEHRRTSAQGLFHLRRGTMSVFGEKEGHQLRVNLLHGAEVTPKETADQIPIDRSVVAREMDVAEGLATALKISFQSLDLGGLPCPVKAFEDNQHVDRLLQLYKYIHKILYFCLPMKAIDPHRPIRVMGILNLTPDSFYAPSRHNLAILESGADLIDIGACSTRPGSKPVGAREEWRRMKSTLARIRERYPDLPLSIDTYWSDVVRRAYDLIGPFIVNDVSGGDADPRMLATVAELGLTYIPMHHGPAESAGDVLEWYETLAAKTEYQGIRDWIVDPGFGFGKTVEQNFGVFHTMDQLKALHRPLLVGISRKRMVWMPLGLTPDSAGEATQRLHLEALRLGADILRTHDVAATRATVALYRQSAGAGTL